MNRFDDSRSFIPVRIAVLTVSDTRTHKTDKSGPLLIGLLQEAGHELAEHAIAEDNVKSIRKHVKRWIKDPEVDVVITTGGTGFTGRDVTPEAVKPLFEKEIEGFSVLFHMVSYQIGRHLDGAVARLRRSRRGHLYLLGARIARSMPGRLERHSQSSARQSPPPLLVRRDHAAAVGEAEEKGES